MSFTSENRKTQIDFNKLKLSPRYKTDVLDQVTQEPAGKEHNAGDRANLKQGATKTSTRKRSLYPEGGRLENGTDLKPLILPEIVRSGIRAHEYLETVQASPWKSYVKLFDIRLGEENIFVTVAERKNAQYSTLTEDPLSDLALVESFSGPRVEEKLREIQKTRDTNIVSPLNIFRVDGDCYVAFEYMAYSLYYITGSPLLDEIRLAAVVGQILNGLIYLVSKGLELGSLTCSNILIHPYGDVKIHYSTADAKTASQDYELRRYDSTESRYIRALGIIVMELMQGYAKEDGAIGVDNLHRWPVDSNAVKFLSTTVTATSLNELIKHPLLRLSWQKGMLKGLVSFVSFGTHIGLRYPPK